jgi:hypothetical protein
MGFQFGVFSARLLCDLFKPAVANRKPWTGVLAFPFPPKLQTVFGFSVKGKTTLIERGFLL